jgi:hypothetical protein
VLSADGRYVAFRSAASNLVAGDTNAVQDVFVRDRQAGTTTRVSLASDGTQADALSDEPAISADGRYVAFISEATNLVAGDTNALADVFRHDTQTGTTIRVSLSTSGVQADGRSDDPALNGDGRLVAWESEATNLVAGDTNAKQDIFVRDVAPRPVTPGATDDVVPCGGDRRAAPHSTSPTRPASPSSATTAPSTRPTASSPGSRACRGWNGSAKAPSATTCAASWSTRASRPTR